MDDVLRFVTGPLAGPVLPATYNGWLVALSYFVASFAAYTAVDLAGRVREFSAEPRRAAAWLCGGALAMGAGIWSMHFVGMLAYELPVQVRYDLATTVASMVAAVATSGFALHIVTRNRRSATRLAVGGAVMGAGIGAMHYIGMAGMRLDAVLMYYPGPFALSVVNAIVCSTAALWLMTWRDDARGKAVAAAVMGVAIAGMHYTGMWAAICVAAIGPSGLHIGLDPVLLAVAITMITLFMMGMALVLSQQNQLMSRTLREQNLLLRNDIAERKKVEELLREAKAVAEAANAAKSQFLATMSHEIRTPMNGVLGMTELLIDSALSPQQRNWVEAVQSSGQHLLGVINDVLDFSKIESGQLELEAVDFLLVDVVEDALAMFAQPAEQKGLELAARFVPNDASMAVRGDAFRLRQVLANLIGNAIKFTPEGEVVVHVVLDQQTATDASITVCVQDTGIGIDAEAHERIFEHFSQADGTTTRRFGGTGLGLAICKRMLDLMGGSIRVESALGSGSKFTVQLNLPIARSMVAAPISSSALAGTRVLVVDDNQTNREILRQRLEGWNMQVSCASGGQEALQVIGSAAQIGQPFDLAVLDMHMPHMDGLQLAGEIRTRREAAATRLIMLSSTFANADQTARQQVGVLRYLNKPIRRADLFNVISSVLTGGTDDSPAQAALRPDAPPGLAGHVLLVEDNPINQGVANAMLRKLGLSTTLAVDGTEAVDHVRNQRFDLVLMDCQMPIMDGYEATAVIRRLPAGRHLPIIALTANAMQGDEQRCLDAGMSAFLAKPYTMPELRSMLMRWMPSIAERHDVAAEPPDDLEQLTAGVVQGTESPIDLSAIQSLRELDETGSMALAKELLQAFLDTADGAVNQVAASIRAGDSAQLGKAAHALKSSTFNVGAKDLSSCYRELERMGREGRIEAAPALFDKTRFEHERAVARLREILLEVA